MTKSARHLLKAVAIVALSLTALAFRRSLNASGLEMTPRRLTMCTGRSSTSRSTPSAT